MFVWPTESLVRYRLLSEPELSILLKTTLSNGSIQSSTNGRQPDPENASSSDMPENGLLEMDDNDNNSQNRNNNNLVQSWDVFYVLNDW